MAKSTLPALESPLTESTEKTRSQILGPVSPQCYSGPNVAKSSHSKPSERPAGQPEAITPDRLPDPWLVDSEYLLNELSRIRRLALMVPFTTNALDMVQPVNSVIDALWRLEEQLRFLLQMHRAGQREFAKKSRKTTAAAVPPPRIVRLG
jgi:hypothetical protein